MRPALLATIPVEVRAEIGDRLADQVGFGAGPGCVAVNIQQLDPPISLEAAMAWLEGYRGTFRKGHLKVRGGARLLFDPSGFVRLAAPGEP